MQHATISGIRIRSPTDARVIFHAVSLGILPMVTRRLDTEERSLISPGSVYVWEERGPHADVTGVGIERWTDGIRWGPSRVREGFLFYHEKTVNHSFSEGFYDSEDGPMSPNHDLSRTVLIKQTYTVHVETEHGQRKWHLIAYFTEESVVRLRSIDDFAQLATLHVPHGKYRSARSAKGRPDHIFNPESVNPPPRLEPSRHEYSPYMPRQSHHAESSMSQTLTWIDTSPRELGHQEHYSPSRRGPASCSSSDEPPENLAPLAYLQNIAPPRRHPVDEKTLMLFTPSAFVSL